MSSVDPALSRDARGHFMLALRRILRPIIRLLIRNGIGYAEFADVARGAYVESAIRNTVKDGAKPSREQVARITGIPLERVDHYIDDQETQPSQEFPSTDGTAEVLHKWHTDPKYLSPDGTPLELPFDAPSGPSFQGLVAEVNTKVSSESVVEDLLSTKSVVYSDESRLRVVTRCFLWPGEWTHSIEHFGSSLAHLIQTLEYNFQPTNAEIKRLERFVSADQGLPAGLLQSFQEFTKERADQFLYDLDDWLARFCDTKTSQEKMRADAGVNVFFYLEPPPDPRSLSTLVQPALDMATPEGGPAP